MRCGSGAVSDVVLLAIVIVAQSTLLRAVMHLFKIASQSHITFVL